MSAANNQYQSVEEDNVDLQPTGQISTEELIASLVPIAKSTEGIHLCHS